MLKFKTYTVESVTSGHPDKICDQVSDAILDECLRQDPKSRVAVESFGSHGLFVVGGEVTTHAKFDAAKIARKIYKDIGYTEKLNLRSPIYLATASYGHFGKPGLPWENTEKTAR